MRTSYLARVWIVGLLCVLPGWRAARAARPFDLEANDPDAARKILTLVTDWVKAFTAADSEGDVLKLRGRMMANYRYCVDRGHGYTLAQEAVRQMAPLLAGGLKADDPLRRVKRINVALIFSQVGEIPVQGVLDAMVAGGNSGVRLLGWSGYRRLRERLLSQGINETNQMFVALGQAAAKERSLPVLEKLLAMATPPTTRPGGLDEAVWQHVQQESMAAVESVWLYLCGRVRVGSFDASDAARSGVLAMKNLHSLAPADAKRTKAIIQLLLDVTSCASKAYNEWFGYETRVTGEIRVGPNVALFEASAAGVKVEAPSSCRLERTAPGRYTFVVEAAQLPALRKAITEHGTLTVTEKREGGMAIVEANDLLLRRCEKALNDITRQGKNSITKPLTARRIAARGAAVWEGAKEWEDALVKLYEVRRPKDARFLPPKPAAKTQPASAPAGVEKD